MKKHPFLREPDTLSEWVSPLLASAKSYESAPRGRIFILNLYAAEDQRL